MKDFAKYLLTLLLLGIVCVVNASMYVVQRENTSRVRNLPVLLNEVKHSAEVEIMHNRAEFNKFWNRNMERVQKSNSAFLSESILTKTSQFLSARPSVKTMLNSHRSGIRKKEKVDDNSIIVEPDDGESKMYIRTGNAYYWNDGQAQSVEQSGMTEIVVTAENDVYIKNFVSRTSFGTWIKGWKKGNTITIPSKQVINYWSDYNYGMYVSMASLNEDGSWTEVDSDITLTIDNDVISLNGTNDHLIVACFWTDDLTFSGYGDYNTVFTYDESYIVPKLVELPEGANVETWYGDFSMGSGNGNSRFIATTKVAFVDNEIYLGGVFQNYPNSWIKGTVEDGNVTFEGFQYVGDYNASYNIYAIGFDGSELVDFHMSYDAEKQMLTSVNRLVANAALDKLFYLEYYEKIVVSKDEPVVQMDTISVYVDSEESPYLYTWGKKTLAGWPGIRMTEQTEVGGIKFWKMDVSIMNSNSSTSLISNGDLEGDNYDNFISKEYPSSEMKVASIVEGVGKDNSRCVVVKSADETGVEESYSWDSQFWIYFNSPINSGTKLHVEFDYKANKETWASTQSHTEPGNYIYWDCIGVVNFTTEWQHFETEIEVSSDMAGANGMQSIAFNLAEDKTAADYYFDNFNVQVISEFSDALNIIFNNGGSYQTADINNVEGKRYYWYGGKTTYKDVTEEVEKGTYKTPMIEEIYFANDYSYYYYEGDTLYYDNVKMTFHNNSGSQPYNYYGTIRLYKGNSMTFVSEIPMVDIQFYTDYDDSYYVRGQANVGVLEDNHWMGDTSELTITNNTGNQQRFSKVVITYDNPTDSEIFERLQEQLDESESALANLTYTNVPGHDYVSHLVSVGRDIELNEDFDGTYVKRLIQELKQQTEWMVMGDGYYQQIATRIAELKNFAANNRYINQDVLTEATAYCDELTVGLSEGKYLWNDISAIFSQLSDYINKLQEIYLVLRIDEPGSLGDSILACVENFSDVIGLRVSGYLNTSDMNNLKNRLTNVKYLDLGETNLSYIASEQFRNHTSLQNIVLPKGLNRIDSYAFYGCINLLDAEFPASLRTIDSYAFYNCAFENVVVPEGVTTINQYAFACSNNYSYSYDENGNYIVDYYRATLLNVSLPSTLRTLGNYVFSYQRKLNTVSMADGLTAIPSYAFYYCQGLTDIRIPATLKSIDYDAFYECSSLRSVALPEGLNTIGEYAFYGCSNLEEVILPTTLASLNYSFGGCNNMTRMTCKAIVPPSTNNNSILGGSESLCTLTVPNLSINVYKQTDYWDQFNIVGADILPDDIYIVNDYKLSWPDSISLDYKPNISITSVDYSKYGSLTVNGRSTLSAGQFYMMWDENSVYSNNYWDNNLQRYDYNRNRYASLVNNATVRADNISIYLSLRSGCWAFLSLPYDVKVSEIGVNWAETPFVIRKYDGQNRAEGLMGQTWVDMTADSILHAGVGYIWNSASTENNRNYTGFIVKALQTVNKNNIFANDNVEVPLNYYESEFPQNRSWNLIGNPYPCFYDIRAIQTSAPVIVWDNYYQNYQAYSPLDDNYILNPGQAFFVQRPIDEESILFLKEGRQTDTSVRNISYNNGSRMMAPGMQRSVFNVILSNGEQGDRTRFVISGNASTAYEMSRDASKFSSLESAIQLYTIESGVQFAINERPLANGVVRLGMHITQRGSYTIKLDTNVDNEVFIIDNMMGTETLLDGDGYVFNTEAGTFDNRFELRLGNGETTGIMVHEDEVKSTNYFNLNGVRVQQPTKGLYINDGKKVVVK